jgi:hypothetical protein
MSAPLRGLALAVPELTGVSTWSLPALVASSVSGWGVFLLMSWLFVPARLLSLEGKRQHLERIPSIFHGAIATTLGIAIMFSVPATCTTKRPSGEDVPFAWLIRAALINSIGYLLVDLSSILYVEYHQRWRPRDHGVLAHHIFVSTCFYVGIQYDLVLWYAAVLLVNEASVLPLNMLMIMRFNKMTDRTLYFVCGILSVIVYFFSRIVVLPVGFYAFFRHGFCFEEQGVVVAGIASANYVFLICLNCFWFRKLLRGALKTLGWLPDTKRAPLLPDDRHATRH